MRTTQRDRSGNYLPLFRRGTTSIVQWSWASDVTSEHSTFSSYTQLVVAMALGYNSFAVSLTAIGMHGTHGTLQRPRSQQKPRQRL